MVDSRERSSAGFKARIFNNMPRGLSGADDTKASGHDFFRLMKREQKCTVCVPWSLPFMRITGDLDRPPSGHVIKQEAWINGGMVTRWTVNPQHLLRFLVRIKVDPPCIYVIMSKAGESDSKSDWKGSIPLWHAR